jgi:hypothetical protein
MPKTLRVLDNGGDEAGVGPFGLLSRTFCVAKWPSPAVVVVKISE